MTSCSIYVNDMGSNRVHTLCT